VKRPGRSQGNARVEPTRSGPRMARPRIALIALLLLGMVASTFSDTPLSRLMGPRAEETPVAVIAAPGAPAVIIARIVSPDGVALPGARVHVELERDARVAADAIADDDGYVRLAAIPEGRYLVRAEHEGFAVGAAVHRFPADEAPDVAVRPASTVSGQVLGVDGLPAPDAEVRIVGSGLWPAIVDTTDGSGRFVLASIPPGIYEVHASRREADGTETSAPPRLGLNIAPGDRAVLSFVLSGGVSLAGVVLDDDTGDPVAGAEVRLATETLSAVARTAITGLDGTFRFAGLEDRTHRLTITDDVHVAEVGIDANPGAALRIRMSRGASISGVVLDHDHRPVGGASIEVLGSGSHGMPITVGASASIAASAGVPGRLEVTDYVPPIPLVPGESLSDSLGSEASGRGIGRLVTEADGTFHIEGVPPGLVQVVARAPEHASAASDAFRLRSGEARTGIEILLGASGRLEGTVVDENDEVMPSTLVEVRSESDPLTRMAVTDREGHFGLGDVAGTVRVRVNAPNRPPAEVRAEVPSGGTRNVTIRLDPGGLVLIGAVVDSRGRAIEGAQVRVIPLRVEGGSTRTVFTDALGRFEADRVPSPPLRVIVEHPDYASSGGIEVTSLSEVTVTLEAALHATGQVTDPWSGLGVMGAAITLISDATPPIVRNVEANDEGAYQVLRLGPGRWTRRVSAEGYVLAQDSVNVRANRWGEVELSEVELSPGVSFEGDVVDRLGRVVLGAELTLDGDPDSMVRSDEHGHFAMTSVGAGDHQLRVISSAGELRHDFEVRADRAPPNFVAHLPGRSEDDVAPRAAVRGVPVELSEGRVTWMDDSLRSLGLLRGDRVVAVDGRSLDAGGALTGTGTALLRIERGEHSFHVLAPRRLWSR